GACSRSSASPTRARCAGSCRPRTARCATTSCTPCRDTTGTRGTTDMDPNKLTMKSQTALEGARQQAVARNHQAIEPEHLLFALLSDPEGVVYPLLHAVGAAPKPLRDQVDAALDRLPKVFAQGGVAEVRISPTLGQVLDAARLPRERLPADYHT